MVSIKRKSAIQLITAVSLNIILLLAVLNYYWIHTDQDISKPSDLVDWTMIENFDSLTATQLLGYFLWSNRSSCGLIHDFGGMMFDAKNSTIRAFDGHKAICLDKDVAPRPGHCLVYSFGINFEWSFDEEMESYGCQVYSFDPTMDTDEDQFDHSAKIHFYKMGLSDRENSTHRLKSLDSFYKMLSTRHGDVPIDYLKIDIEFAEWGCLPQIISSGMIDRIRQMAVEVHLGPDETVDHLRELAGILRSLERSGMVRFDSKYNPWSENLNFAKIRVSGYMAYEIAWYNSKYILYH